MNNLENLLLQFMVPDNNTRKAAEEQIRKLSKDSQIVPALVQLVRSAQSPAVRQLAAVILRKKVTGHWMRLPADVKNSSKTAFLESVTTDPSYVAVRKFSLLCCLVFRIWDWTTSSNRSSSLDASMRRALGIY